MQLEQIKEIENLCRQKCRNKGNCKCCAKLRNKRSEMSLKRNSDFQFFEFEDSGSDGVTLGGHTSTPKIRAHGVGGLGGADGEIFLSANNTLVETHKGTDTTLNCRIARDSDYGTISWFKRSGAGGGLVLLTVGDNTYIGDSRVSIVRPVLSMNWSLQIRQVRPEDGGEYVCQTSQHPPSNHLVQLKVYEAYAAITGSKEKVFRTGSEMQLVCVIKDITQAPTFIFWYHDARMINYDTVSGVSVLVSPVTSRTLRSVLTISSVTMSHGGRYSCSPSQVQSDTVTIRVKHREEGQPEPVVNSGRESVFLSNVILVIIITMIEIFDNIIYNKF